MSQPEPQPEGNGFPQDIATLLRAEERPDADELWARFVQRHSKLLLHVAHQCADSYDGAMDRYAYVLERLKADDFKRLRGYRADGRGRFTTWLSVVARRLCADFHRSRFGRPRATNGSGNGQARREQVQTARARLADFVMERLDPTLVSRSDQDGPERKLRRSQLHTALHAALSTLDPEDQLLFKLRFEDELPAREVADVMDLPTPFHVYRRVNKRLKDLRESLENSGFTDPRP